MTTHFLFPTFRVDMHPRLSFKTSSTRLKCVGTASKNFIDQRIPFFQIRATVLETSRRKKWFHGDLQFRQ